MPMRRRHVAGSARASVWRASIGLAGGLLLTLAACSEDTPDSAFRFAREDLDLAYGGNGHPGWVRAGDVDGDGDLDVVAGGGEALFVYENTGGARGWPRHGTLDATESIGANGAELFDVDGDGDLDVVSARYRDALGWWENPGGPLTTRPWPHHPLHPQPGFFAHDVMRADVDGDGRREEFVFVLARKPEVRVEWYRIGPHADETWLRQIVEPGRDEGATHYAGIDVGDIDADGDPDIAFSNGWYEARGVGQWAWHALTETPGISNTRIRDLDGDGRLDLVVSAGHHGHGVYWLEPGSDPRGAWTQHPIDPELLHPECLQVEDLDRDGDLDIVTCELDFERWDREVHGVYMLENAGAAARWIRHAVGPPGFPSHLLQTADLDGDGWLDLLSEAAGHSVVSIFRRIPPPPPREPQPD